MDLQTCKYFHEDMKWHLPNIISVVKPKVYFVYCVYNKE